MADKSTFGKIIFLIVGLIIGFQFAKWIIESSSTELEKVEQVFKLTEEYYYQKIDPDTLSERAINGIFEKLDPHSVYFSQDIQEAMQEQLQGNFEGIGVEFQIIEDTITVVSPIIGGPSERLGIQAGDKIIEIEDSSAIGFSNTDVIKKLRGKEGTEVNVTIFRPSQNEIFHYTITRDVIPIHSVETSLILQDSVGYVSVSRFAEQTTDELKEAFNSLTNEGMKYLILDLRNNPGGFLDQAVSVSDLFIEGEKLIVYTDGRVPEFDEEYKASESSEYENIPLIIIINRGSASASEIVSGAVQDWDRGLVIGETSFGKGLVQRSFILADKSAIRLTISEYFTPSGRAIQRPFENKHDYYEEIMNRNDDTLHVKDDTTKTDSPDETANGGIEPDYFVRNENLTKFTASLRGKNLFYLFIRNQLDDGKFKLDEKLKNDLTEFTRSEIITKEKLIEFKSYIKSKGIESDEEQFQTDSVYISDMLRAHLAREYFNSKGWYTILLKHDSNVQKALELLDESKHMLKK